METINNSSTSIKNWAVDDRPREKLLAQVERDHEAIMHVVLYGVFKRG